jgi:hypothetical protein
MEKLRGQEFANIIMPQKDRLSARWSAKKVDNIERDFEALRGAYEREPSLQQVFDQCSSMTTFDESWSYVEKRWPLYFLARLLWRVTFRLSIGRKIIARFLYLISLWKASCTPRNSIRLTQ